MSILGAALWGAALPALLALLAHALYSSDFPRTPLMSGFTRGEFLSLAALAAGDGVLPQSVFGRRLPSCRPAVLPSLSEPDLILVNGRVYTMDPAMPRAESFAVKDGRFVVVGSNDDVRNLATPRTRVLDAERMTVTPGFIDAHCHPRGVNELFGVNANLRSIAELQAALRKKAAETPPGIWVEAFMFDDTKLGDPRPLHRTDLDAATTEHPVGVHHRGGHTTWYNSKAFELAGITRETPDPDHGRFFRDQNGDLSGRVAELARNVLATVGRREELTEDQTRERNRAGMRHISELLTTAGLTS
ncbi:MAG: amidohydrolase family protein, partial [Gemmatimonadales bacterium]